MMNGPKFGSNLIGEEAITAKNALTQTVLHKTIIIHDLQKKIMNKINQAIENDLYEATILYKNDDSIVDDWISEWLTDLGYSIHNFEDYEGEEDANVTITVNWHRDNIEDEENDKEESNEEEIMQESEGKQTDLFDDIVKTAKNDAENAPEVEYP